MANASGLLSSTASGAAMGSVLPGVGTVVGGLAGLGMGIMGMFGGGDDGPDTLAFSVNQQAQAQTASLVSQAMAALQNAPLRAYQMAQAGVPIEVINQTLQAERDGLIRNIETEANRQATNAWGANAYQPLLQLATQLRGMPPTAVPQSVIDAQAKTTALEGELQTAFGTATKAMLAGGPMLTPEMQALAAKITEGPRATATKQINEALDQLAGQTGLHMNFTGRPSGTPGSGSDTPLVSRYFDALNEANLNFGSQEAGVLVDLLGLREQGRQVEGQRQLGVAGLRANQTASLFGTALPIQGGFAPLAVQPQPGVSGRQRVQDALGFAQGIGSGISSIGGGFNQLFGTPQTTSSMFGTPSTSRFNIPGTTLTQGLGFGGR